MASLILTSDERGEIEERPPFIRIASEQQLLALVAALLPSRVQLSDPERLLLRPVRPITDARLIGSARDAMLAGQDPLGSLFCKVRSSETRRQHGAVYTPTSIISAMMAWGATNGSFARIVDPGAGSGRFLFAAGRAWQTAELIAVEIDPLAALILRAGAELIGLTDRIRLVVGDYRDLELTDARGRTFFVGNPPYVRHHEISPRWKAWYSAETRRLASRGSQLAGLHLHFFFKTLGLAREGDVGCFVTAAEWLDVNYGQTLREALLDGLGGMGLHVLDAHAMPFAGAITTAAITCFKIGHKPKHLSVRYVDSSAELGDLTTGESVGRDEFVTGRGWSAIIKRAPKPPPDYVELGEYFAVHRGQVTGTNEVWIESEHSVRIPAKFLFPTVTKARDLIAAGPELRVAERLRRVIDLPANLDSLPSEVRADVERFLNWARTRGAHLSYIAKHRRAWWSVGLLRPAPIICTYMARRPPVFVRNLCDARHLNISHGLYPRAPMPDAVLKAIVAWLGNHVDVGSGRTYAGGLTKFEPGEIERIPIPRREHFLQ